MVTNLSLINVIYLYPLPQISYLSDLLNKHAYESMKLLILKLRYETFVRYFRIIKGN